MPLSWLKHVFFLLAASALAIPVTQAVQADELDYCAAKYPSITSYEPPPQFAEDRRDKIDISANKTLSGKDGSSTFEGDVILERHELRIKADTARFDNTSREISVYGNVRLGTPVMSLTADSGRFFLDDNNTEFNNIEFFIPETRLRGHADQVTSEGNRKASLDDSSITSCPPGDVDWLLSANSIDLDLQDEYGKARDVDQVMARCLRVLAVEVIGAR